MLKVAKNNHIYLSAEKHYYSVPHTLMGHQVKVTYTRSIVYLYHEGKKVAVHSRNFKLGAYSTVKEHLCSHHQHYRDRSPEYYRNLSAKISKVLYEYVYLLFEQKRYLEQVYRSCDGLVALARKSDTGALEKACKTAMENGVFSYRFIKDIIENHMEDESVQNSITTLPKHQNVRSKSYYSIQQSINFK